MRRTSEVLDQVILYVLYGLTASFTLICWPGFESPFLLVKATVLRVTAAVLLMLWTVSCALSGRVKWRRTPLDIPLAGLLAAGIVSTVFSMNRQASLVGAVRQEGLWILFIYTLLYYLSAWYLGQGKRWLTALRLIALSSLAPAAITLLQKSGVDFSGLFDRDVMTYMGTFGNRPFYGYYLALVLPVIVYLAWREKARWKRGALAVAGTVNLYMLYVTGNRAAALGVLCSGIACLVMLSLRSRNRLKVILVGAGVIVLAVALLFGATWGTRYGARLRSAVSFGDDQNAQGRLSFWRSSLRMIADRPAQGYGMESYAFDYQRYMEPYVDEFGKRENAIPFYDNPHNQTLYMGVSLGVAGMVFYLLLYGVLLWRLGRCFRRSQDPWFYGAVFCAVLGYFVGVQFLSDLPSVTPYLWILVGLALGRSEETESLPEAPEGIPEDAALPDEAAEDPSGETPETQEEAAAPVGARGRWLRAAVSAAAVLLALAVSVTSTVYAVRFLLADRHYFRARELGKEPAETIAGLDPVIEELRRAVSLDPLNADYRTPLAQLFFNQAELTKSTGPAWEAVVLARDLISRYPTDSRAFVLLGSAYAYVYMLTGEPGYRQMAVEQFETALELYPYCRDAEKALDLLEAR